MSSWSTSYCGRLPTRAANLRERVDDDQLGVGISREEAAKFTDAFLTSWPPEGDPKKASPGSAPRARPALYAPGVIFERQVEHDTRLDGPPQLWEDGVEQLGRCHDRRSNGRFAPRLSQRRDAKATQHP
jgi:hypothetical protein